MKTFCRRCLGLLLAPLLLASPGCQRPEEPTKPADLLPKDQMIRLLADLHVLEARVENSRLPQDSARALYQAQHKALLWNREVTDSAFQRSYRYYGIHGKDLSEIYGAVIDTLNKRTEKLEPAKVGPVAPATQALPENAASLAK
ncbi:DUF4296 domain-containing protein [Hymenobacter sp. BT523]|uniref:DUF4296 domain-containing protein n=1 Tax=Hymenobacter sp. BT523 TaxID=2795725 RepID=UPI0018EA6360|nr:DUF4296 domain-containing protein [Hymenobacter sp. BT523]MBJ6111691.1 DUF4296 domain-containing protein [Hymenobacter sp. BT523]